MYKPRLTLVTDEVPMPPVPTTTQTKTPKTPVLEIRTGDSQITYHTHAAIILPQLPLLLSQLKKAGALIAFVYYAATGAAAEHLNIAGSALRELLSVQ